MTIPWYKELILTHSIDGKGNVMLIKDTAGNPRFDLQWELERWQNDMAETKQNYRLINAELDKRMTRMEFMQAIWGVLMIVVSTASLAVLLYAVLE